MRKYFSWAGQVNELELTESASGYSLQIGDQILAVEKLEINDQQIRFELDGEGVRIDVVRHHDEIWISLKGRAYRIKLLSRAARQAEAAGVEGTLVAPMPGQIRAIECTVGDSLNKGQTVLLLEAMKLEIKIQAAGDGVLETLDVQVGDQVQKDQVLGRIRPV